MADAIRGNRFALAQVGVLQGIHLGGPSAWRGENSNTWRQLQVGVSKEETEGFSTAPSLKFLHVGFWRFKWVVTAGDRTLEVYAKQAANANPRPSVILKANADVGLAADAEFSASASAGWVKITATFTATADGVIWVELHANLRTGNYPAYFDHIVTS